MGNEARRPNIVMIVTDDHASRAIGAYGSEINRTPNIDAIGESGWTFDNCFATNALCAPSRASILTGTHSHVNGVTTLSTPIDAGQPTFITQLRDAGYRTAMVGKWHMGHGPGADPEGFDYWDVFIGDGGQGEYIDPTFLSAGGERTVHGYATDIVTDLSIDWVESLPGDDPWCVLVYHKAPHRPWIPDAAHAGIYADPIPVPGTLFDDHASRSASATRATMRILEDLDEVDLKVAPPEGLDRDELTRWKYQRFMEDYLACVASVDDNVGRISDWLTRRGDYDDTVLVYASDQGFFLGDHGWFDKRFMYEESLRMPFLISYPRALAAGRRHSGIVTNVDIAQSLLDAAGVAHHPRMQGRSFWPDVVEDATRGGVGTGEPAAGMYYRYWENHDGAHRAPAHYGYRDERYKLIYFYNDGMGIVGNPAVTFPPEWELYDLVEDPAELRNVAHDPAYAEVRARLEVDLWRAQELAGDQPHPSQPVPAGLA